MDTKEPEEEKKEEGDECCFDDCEETFKYGNNALPLREGKCCNECNSTKVIPARLMVFLAGF